MNILARRLGLALLAVLSGLPAGAFASASVSPAPSPGQELAQADRVKTSDHARFLKLLAHLDDERGKLNASQRELLRFFDAWQLVYSGHYRQAEQRLDTIIAHSADPTVRFRAMATSINLLGIGHQYEKAFARLSHMLDLLPRVHERQARFQGLGEAAQLLIAAGQYDLADSYAAQMLNTIPAGQNTCKPLYFRVHARAQGGKLALQDPLMKQGIAACVADHESIVANALRADQARLELEHGRAGAAVALLEAHYADVLRNRYPNTITEFNALLAQAYKAMGKPDKAKHYALAAVHSSIHGQYTQSRSNVFRVLYQLAQARGDYRAALDWHEKYMAADKGYLDSLSARTVAYQMVQQQVRAQKLQVESLNRQNRILQLRQALDRKQVENSRLYIVLLLGAIGSIGLWVFRLKRSQLRFMQLARHDGLTGILNRKHFLEEADRSLQYARKSSRDACLVLIDLDHFKRINDTHGHATGDRVLKQVVVTCRQHLTSVDVFGRLGGEEFGMLMPECTADQAVPRVERLRRAIAALSPQLGVPGMDVSASFGVAASDEHGYVLHALLIAADAALYDAKRGGRNRLAVAEVGDASQQSLA